MDLQVRYQLSRLHLVACQSASYLGHIQPTESRAPRSQGRVAWSACGLSKIVRNRSRAIGARFRVTIVGLALQFDRTAPQRNATHECKGYCEVSSNLFGPKERIQDLGVSEWRASALVAAALASANARRSWSLSVLVARRHPRRTRQNTH